MRLAPLLLRLLLVLALALNGTGAAFARHVHAAPAPVADAQAGSHCHESTVTEAAPAADPGAPCCDEGACDCACTAGMAVLALSVPFVASVPPGARIGHRLAAGHHAPALAHPIRPPIDPAVAGA